MEIKNVKIDVRHLPRLVELVSEFDREYTLKGAEKFKADFKADLEKILGNPGVIRFEIASS